MTPKFQQQAETKLYKTIRYAQNQLGVKPILAYPKSFKERLTPSQLWTILNKLFGQLNELRKKDPSKLTAWRNVLYVWQDFKGDTAFFHTPLKFIKSFMDNFPKSKKGYTHWFWPIDWIDIGGKLKGSDFDAETRWEQIYKVLNGIGNYCQANMNRNNGANIVFFLEYLKGAKAILKTFGMPYYPVKSKYSLNTAIVQNVLNYKKIASIPQVKTVVAKVKSGKPVKMAVTEVANTSSEATTIKKLLARIVKLEEKIAFLLKAKNEYYSETPFAWMKDIQLPSWWAN